MPALDGDDEIALMARDSGERAPAGAPSGADGRTRVDFEVTDPAAPGRSGWFSLFRRTAPLDPGAGRRLVTYSFGLQSGAYKTTYRLDDGPNPENSSVSTPFYRHHFADRWLSDQIRVDAGAATGADILDRHKPQFAPGNCGRTEDTFNDAEGAFVVNKSGPVRALRSYIGANSGPLTQREHVFYERRQDIRTDLRVHAIGGIMDYLDYSPAANGMTYRSSAAPGGVTINGSPDSPASGALVWESVDGPQGGLSISHAASTDISPLTLTSYYFDDSTPAEHRGRAPVHRRQHRVRRERALDHQRAARTPTRASRGPSACGPPATSTTRSPARRPRAPPPARARRTPRCGCGRSARPPAA